MKRRIATLHVTSASEDAPLDAFSLATLTECLAEYGVSASFELGASGAEGAEREGWVWLDVSGVGHLHGGEEALARSLLERAEVARRSLALDEVSLRLVIASGPQVGKLLLAGVSALGPALTEEGRFAFVAEAADTPQLLEKLPIELLLGAQAEFWKRLGVHTLKQLLALPPSTVTARLGPGARARLALAHGEDDQPLSVHRPPRTIELRHEWDEPCEGLEPLRFVLRGLFERIGARLAARGEGATRLALHFDWQVEFGKTASFSQEFALPAPLGEGHELERVATARLERLTLPGPVFGVTASAAGLTAKPSFQLELSADPRAARRQVMIELTLPLLVTELESELGATEVGCLAELSSHCPEERSELVPWRREREAAARTPSGSRSVANGSKRPRAASAPAGQGVSPLDEVTRLLPRPLLLTRSPTEGGFIELGERVYRVRHMRFAQRLSLIRWWTQRSASRDYFWLWLEPLAERATRAGGGRTECALVYADRRAARVPAGSNGEGNLRYYLQGFGALPDDD